MAATVTSTLKMEGTVLKENFSQELKALLEILITIGKIIEKMIFESCLKIPWNFFCCSSRIKMKSLFMLKVASYSPMTLSLKMKG